MVVVLVFDKLIVGLFQVLAHSLAESSLPLAESWIALDIHNQPYQAEFTKMKLERGTLMSEIEGKILTILFVEEYVEELIIG